MKYYLHSVDTMDDEKIAELYQMFGYEGTGLFHAILEKIAKQEKPIKTSVLKKQLNVGKKLNKIWFFMEEIGLICSNNGETFNEQLLNFSEKYKIKSEKNAKRISEWRKNKQDTKNVTRNEQVCNTAKVKESKVNKNKKKIFIPPQLSDVVNYFLENGYSSESAERAFDYYDKFDWKDKNGKKVSDWKRKMFSVWFKDENKVVEKRMSKNGKVDVTGWSEEKIRQYEMGCTGGYREVKQ